MLIPIFGRSPGFFADFSLGFVLGLLRGGLLLAALCAGVSIPVDAAPSLEATEQELKGVHQDLKAEQARLAALEAEREAALDRLRVLENQQAEAARALYEARFAVGGKEQELADLRVRHERLEGEIAQGLLSLEDNLRALYLLGSGHGLEGVLSPGGRADKMRVEGYLEQLRADRVDALQRLRSAREDNVRVQHDIEFTLEELTRVQLLAESEQQRLDSLRAQHQRAVDALEASQDAVEARVRRMLRDQQSLERTLAKLEQAEEEAQEAENKRRAEEEAERRREEQARQEQLRQAQLQKEQQKKIPEKQQEDEQSPVDSAAEKKPEERRESPDRKVDKEEAENSERRASSPADRGDIPVSGRKIRSYGEPTGVGELRSRGVFFAAPEGSRVRALEEGKVVFADWVRGYGNLLIVQHKGGYLSLYAQNEALLKRNGARVQRGEVLATAGRSGGEKQTGVYIEVRRGGQPINPTRWSAWPKK